MTDRRSASTFLMLVTFLAFISIGFPDAVLGVAWPSMRDTFDRALPDIGFILFASGSGYFLSGLLAGRLIERLGVGVLLAISTGMVAAGLFGYAAMPAFWPLLLAAALIGLGSGAIDTALNVFAAENFSVTVMNWLHAFFGIGAMLGPMVMASVFAAGGSWRVGYLFVALFIAAMAVVFALTTARWVTGVAEEVAEEPKVAVRAVVRMPLVWLQVIVFFTMCGIEASGGLWTATSLIERFDSSAREAGIWAGLFWGALALGRLILSPLSRGMDPARLVQLCTFGVLGGSLLMIADVKAVYQGGLLLCGLAMGPLFPTLMSLTPARLGARVATHAIGFQVSAATLGIVGLPTVAGLVADRSSLVMIPILMSTGAVIVIALETLLRTRTAATADPDLATA